MSMIEAVSNLIGKKIPRKANTFLKCDEVAMKTHGAAHDVLYGQVDFFPDATHGHVY
jgi:hypothetical protein